MDAVYEAAICPERWPVVLRALADRVGAEEGLLFAEDFRSTKPPLMTATRGAGDEALQRFALRHRRNPWSLRSLAQPAGTILRTEELVPRAELLDSDFFRECLAPLGLWHSLGGNVINEPGLLVCFSFLRSPRRGSFDDVRLRRMQQYLCHLRRAVRLQLHTRSQDLLDGAALEALEALEEGVFLVDADARVLFANQAGAALLSRGDGLIGGPRGLAARRPSDTAWLRTTIRSAASATRGSGARAIPRDADPWPLRVAISPLGRHSFDGVRGEARVAVFVSDPSRTVDLAVPLLTQAFGLSRAEAHVAVQIARGADLATIAARARVSINTVRTQLARAFDKTHTRRQAELVRLLARFAPSVRAHGAPLAEPPACWPPMDGAAPQQQGVPTQSPLQKGGPQHTEPT